MGILNVRALKDWIALRAVNHMLATEKGYFLDARMGPVIQRELDTLKERVGEINSNLLQKADLNSANVFTDTLSVINMKDLLQSSYVAGPFVSNAEVQINPNARAGYGFHNHGSNGIYLYLELDGTLRFMDSFGNVYQVQAIKI